MLGAAGCGEYSVDVSPIKYSMVEKWEINIEVLLLLLVFITAVCGILYVQYVKKQRKYIKENMLLFTFFELANSFLFFVVLKKVLLFLVLFKISFALFLIFEISIIVIRNTILRFCVNI